MKEYLRKNFRLWIYTACGIGLCWIDLWRGIGNGAQWALAVNCTGFCVFPMIVFRLDWSMLLPGNKAINKWQKVFATVFCLWLIASALFAYPAFRLFAPGTDYDAQIITAIINVILYGAVLIRMYFYLFFERERSTKVTFVFYFWLAFIVLAIASVNSSVWPLWFLVMFGSFYLAPLNNEELTEIIEGLVNGMIIGFFWIQSRAFLYRPYDKDYRYYGHYTNPNVNAMFYLFTYVAWLTKLYIYRVAKKTKRYIFSFLMASSMWVFVFFTGCRSAWIGFAGATFIYLLAESAVANKRKIVTFFGKGALIFAIAAVAFLPVYACMRYIPPLRHHPVWYQAEYSEKRVMSWDPMDSEKYYELDEILPKMLGRLNFVGGETEKPTVVSDEDKGVSAQSEPAEITSVIEDKNPLFDEMDYSSSFLRRVLKIRYYIYSYVISKTSFWGNKQFDPVWLTDSFQLYHAHNTSLMMLFWFGWLSGIPFVMILVGNPAYAAYCLFVKRNAGPKEPVFVGFLFSALASAAYLLIGLSECVAFPGEMGLTLFMIALFPMIRITDNA